MDKTLFFIVSSFLLSVSLQAQKLSVVVNYVTNDKVDNNQINYIPGKFLSWADFNGKPVEGSDAAALTSAGLGLKLAFHRVENSSQLILSVSCNFSKKESWVKLTNKTPYILNHEQKHFDIAYLHTLKFIQQLKKASFTNTNYAAVIEKIYNESISAMSQMQSQYDGETSHSRITQKQSEWDEKISSLLTSTVKE